MGPPGTGRGEAFLERVGLTLETLRLFPEMAPRFSGKLRRQLLGKKRAYGLFSEVAGRRIVVAALLDLRQDPATLISILRSRLP